MVIDYKKREHPENIYAKNNFGVNVFIEDATSGKKGYFCLGCDQEMVAAKSKLGYKSYFRHYNENLPIEKRCTYSSETYRHKLAKEILFIQKQLKVPRLLKYHPTDPNAPAIIIRQAENIIASSVSLEMPFFENEQGEIEWSKEASFHKEHLLIQPDVAFFDQNGKPILLIEIVATHKIDDAKKAKIRRLGINTVFLTVPTDSLQAIEESLQNSQRVKWVFHNEEAESDYLQLSKSSPETISHPDAEQRKLLGETLSCREAEIRRLISAINLCLQSEQYRNTRAFLDSEFTRLKKFTEQQKTELQQFGEKYRRGIAERYSAEEAELDKSFREVSEKLKQVGEAEADLESRYYKKDAELTTDVSTVEQQIRDIRSSTDSTEAGIERESERIRKLIITETLAIGDIESTIFRAGYEIEACEAGGDREAAAIRRELERQIRNEDESIRQIEARRAALSEDYRQKEAAILERFIRDKEELEEEARRFEDRQRQRAEERRARIKQELQDADASRTPPMSELIKGIVSEWECVRVIAEEEPSFTRLETARRALKDGSYKSWMEGRD